MGLDWRSTVGLMSLVEALRAEGASVVLITHDLRLVSHYAEHLTVLEEGVLLAMGPTRQVLSQFDRLSAAFPSPPPLLALAQALAPDGSLGVPLTPQEMHAAILRVQERAR